jgi:hypothetical protein
MALASMNAGKHAGVEVPAVNSLEECQTLVDTSERTRRHCMIMENCCYGYNELLLLNMIRAGLLGDLLHGEAAYIHDLRGELFGDQGEGLWRRVPHTTRNGNLYPTHGLGPIANYMGINRGFGGVPGGECTARQSQVEREIYLRGHEHVSHQDG